MCMLVKGQSWIACTSLRDTKEREGHSVKVVELHSAAVAFRRLSSAFPIPRGGDQRKRLQLSTTQAPAAQGRAQRPKV